MTHTQVTKYKKYIATKIGANFNEVIKLVDADLPQQIPADHIVIKNIYLGINASDINFTAGAYTPGVKPPFDIGFEAIGEVYKVGSDVTKLKIGDPVYFSKYGAFAEYVTVPASLAIKLPSLNPDFLPLFVSGTTASISLEKVGELKSNQTVLVTAAAGGTGQFAVQLAKLAGNKVIGTCGSEDKVKFLKEIGCDRVINYKKEDVGTVLKKEYPNGVDLVYECVGGKMLEAAVNSLAVHGKIVVIGMISGYVDQSFGAKSKEKNVPVELKLLQKSASMRGFFLNHFARDIRGHVGKLIQLYSEGKIKSLTDCHFNGIESVPSAVEYMYKGQNVGKVIVDLRKKTAKL